MRLRYTLPALADLVTILDYVADRSPPGPNASISESAPSPNLLLRYPQAGAVTDDRTIRRMATTPYPYLIFYEATGAESSFTRCATGLRTMLDRSEPCRQAEEFARI